ncbi:sodium/proline symporter PutP [Rossellomorea marisflavi]|uniref:Sodium/proline symporter n=1 Tax=Rossellomorea marisflavi TaxID=189381 RepID=A0A5D4RU37_9BACI|nr:sodium/proline symporter PutP [Rossellomorea marisflavi]KQU60769.1 proline:sodium symporter PutP [Bacillus sp. Leaf406]MDW4526054.1 sodium/proline symporter PutP [Rossellomorea marisflavi]TYS54279.1 sodium/proline symporter PutP [Rossellomorea marisflavi]UKS66732.1 sodium/proline symporter PutP [Rossellomorea marisflavi]WJV17536.1 sodium/proline symporter PutP [Rossellomorea marisflavi]
MDINIETLTAIIIYLVGMLIIGYLAAKLTSDLSDYVLGGRRLTAGVAALSAGSSDMSGWLMLGLPGAVYASGMGSIWLAIGLAVGAYLNWQFVAKPFRVYTEVANDSITVPDYFENRFRDHSKVLRVFSAIIILIFFTFYTSSSLVGGAILLEQSFGMNYQLALWVGAGVILSYTFFGGFLAASWTDFIQGILMFLALIIIPVVAINELGGWSETVSRVGSIDPSHLNVYTGATFASVVSLLAWGLGYFGQPHIIVRFMGIKSTREIPKARLIGMTWMVVSLFGAIFIGFTGFAYFADNPLSNPETVFISFSQILFNPWVAGFLLAAILSAIMSTVDSQLLVSSSALAQDFYKAIFRKEASKKEEMLVGRISVLVIAVIAIFLGYNPNSSVLQLVSYAWAGFGAAFGPLIIFSLFWKRMTRNGALAGMLVGAVTVILWAIPEDGFLGIYELLPGFIFSSLAIIIVSLTGKGPDKEVVEEFELVQTKLKQ